MRRHTRRLATATCFLRRRSGGASAWASTVLALCATGCAMPGAAFVRAERATFDAIAPEYRAYVAADERLSPGQKDRRLRTVETWDLSIGQQEDKGVRP